MAALPDFSNEPDMNINLIITRPHRLLLIRFFTQVVWAVKRFTSGTTNLNRFFGSQSPRDILQARYARGEITREQYQQMVQDLN